jgi:hypothetical protein
VNLNFRKHYRKDVTIGGYYVTVDEERKQIDDRKIFNTIPVNCQVKNISLGGIGFIALDQVRVQVGDKLRVKLTLDKEPPEVIEKDVIVRGISDNYIGCEFIQETGFSDRTLGFYLMK